MAQTNRDVFMSELANEQNIPADGATDAIGLGQMLARCKGTVDDAACGQISRLPVEDAQQHVRDAQSALAALGYPARIDAHWSRDTREALAQFQEEQELQATGRLDAESYERLMAVYEQAVESQACLDDDDFMPIPGHWSQE